MNKPELKPIEKPESPKPDLKLSVNQIQNDVRSAFARNNSRNLKLRIVAVVAVTVGASYFIYNWYFYSKTHISTENAYIVTTPFQVNARMMGLTKEVRIHENDTVKKGDILVLLDDSDIKIELSFKLSKYQKATADRDRARKLRESGAIAQSDLEAAEAMHVAMKADYEGSILKNQFTQIVAPSDGSIAKINILPGQFVQPGQNLMTLIPTGPIWVRANYKETQIERISAGQKVQIHVDAYPDQEFTGEVEGVLPSSTASLSIIQPENNSGNFTKVTQRFPVKIKIDPKAGFPLRPGMSVVPTILISSVKETK